MSDTPPAGIPPLPLDQKHLEAILGGKPIPPPETRITRHSSEVDIATTSPTVSNPPRLRPAVAEPITNPLANLGGTFAPINSLPANVAATLPEARALLAQIVTAIHHAQLNFNRLADVLEPHSKTLKTIHGFDLREAKEFLERADTLITKAQAPVKIERKPKP